MILPSFPGKARQLDARAGNGFILVRDSTIKLIGRVDIEFYCFYNGNGAGSEKETAVVVL